MMRLAHVTLALFLVAVLAGGCGRRGALEPPPDSAQAKEKKPDNGQPGGSRKPPPILPPKRDFILDPLLD